MFVTTRVEVYTSLQSAAKQRKVYTKMTCSFEISASILVYLPIFPFLLGLIFPLPTNAPHFRYICQYVNISLDLSPNMVEALRISLFQKKDEICASNLMETTVLLISSVTPLPFSG